MPTPPEPGESRQREVLEPIRVIRHRSTDALAELFRELTEDPPAAAPATPRAPSVRDAGPPRPGPATRRRRAAVAAGAAPAATVPAVLPGRRRAAVAGGILAAALAGFGGALLLPDRGDATATPPPSTPAGPSAPVTSDRTGILREGDIGPEVSELQRRLGRIPDVYDARAADGRYDSALTEAVARFQLWYGVRGDETGVYGDDTRRELEART
ncbi:MULTISPECIES: peptidoglycan-binding domain-containing protein [unclassified Streptomyces]|uniref:peptidoglycan-binding domain-containing protein n=1 Tax=unclassified Streptomyces TaxID=2593676 RepID=UPI003D747573